MPTTIRLPRYLIPGKSRTYSILAHPPQANLWAYDDYPEDEQLMIDGDRSAFRQLACALAILLDAPMQIIFFPIAYLKPDRRIKRGYAEQMIGDTVFLVLPLEICHSAHAGILRALEDSEEELYACPMPMNIEYLLSERMIAEIYEKE